MQKATASAVMKPAKLETGLMIKVPPFINNGDKVKVDTSEARTCSARSKLLTLFEAQNPLLFRISTPQAIFVVGITRGIGFHVIRFGVDYQRSPAA